MNLCHNLNMKNKKASKGDANKETLGDYMKSLEAVTDYRLMPRAPVYVRLDMRAGHTFCRGLDKPFDMDFVETMQKTCAYLVEKTGAHIGYVQSDEISLVFEDTSKIPFEDRIFKIQSTFAAMAASVFTIFGLKTKLKDRIEKYFPVFDCRVMNVPAREDLVNALLWRENDAAKNSISMVAQSKYSHSKLQSKNSDDMRKMLAADFGIVFDADYPDYLRYGSYYKRVVYWKKLEPDDIAKTPKKQLDGMARDANGNYFVVRSRIARISFGRRLAEMPAEDRFNTVWQYEEPADLQQDENNEN